MNSRDANFAFKTVKKKAPKWFKAWRKGLKLTQKQAAYLLGLKSRMVQNYESGTHDIPLYIRLAMASLSNGVTDFEDNEFKRPGKSLALMASAGLAGQAVRVPRVSPDFRRLLAGFPAGVVAPSANPSGRLSPTSAEHVETAFLSQQERPPEHLALILDEGPCPAGLESTVVDLSDARQPRLLRHGAIAQADIETVLGLGLTVDTDPAVKTAPGQMTRHYAPGAPLVLNAETATPDQAALVFTDPTGFEAASALEVLSPSGSTTEAAAALFAALHRLDGLGPAAIAVGPVPMMGAVAAVTKEFDVPTTVSLNAIMVDGTGMCGGCRVNVGGEAKFVCVDGPEFDGHKVDFDKKSTP